MFHALPDGVRERVHLAMLPMEDRQENAAIVNALQRHAAIVVQKSLAEGFGLTVAEGMWKARPLVASAVGGIADQVLDGETGVLVRDPADLREYGEALARLLSAPDEADADGRARAPARARALHRRPPPAPVGRPRRPDRCCRRLRRGCRPRGACWTSAGRRTAWPARTWCSTSSTAPTSSATSATASRGRSDDSSTSRSARTRSRTSATRSGCAPSCSGSRGRATSRCRRGSRSRAGASTASGPAGRTTAGSSTSSTAGSSSATSRTPCTARATTSPAGSGTR